MAPADPFEGQPPATPRAVSFQRLEGVVRTRRVVPTRRRQERSQEQLVAPYHGREHGAHSGCGSSLSHTLRQTAECRGEVLQGHAVRGREGPDDYIAIACSGQPLGANDFTQPALQSIATHRGLSVLRHYDPHPQKSKRGRTHAKDEAARLQSSSLFPDPINVLATRDPRRSRIHQGSRRRVLRRQLHGETLAPLLATTAQDSSPPAGGHTGPKTVGTNPALVARAIGWLAHSKLSRTIDLRSGKRRRTIGPYLLTVNHLALARIRDN